MQIGGSKRLRATGDDDEAQRQALLSKYSELKSTDEESLFLGFAYGLQYDKTTPSACFLAVKDVLSQVFYMRQDFQNIFETYNLYDPVVYRSTQLFNAANVAFE